jgi:hypothetical protein
VNITIGYEFKTTHLQDFLLTVRRFIFGAGVILS